jgi:hypothetical protein
MPRAPVWVRFEVDAENMEEAEERVYRALDDAKLGMMFQIVRKPLL